MINFTREQRGTAFDLLPQDIKSALTSDTLVETFQKIGSSHNLTIDKIGILADVITLTILNLIPRDSLVNKIKEELGLDDLKANSLAKTINEEVFLKIREILKQEEGKKESEYVKKVTDNENPEKRSDLNKEDILKEIEDPTPMVQMIPKNAESLTHDFINEKLNQTTVLVTEKTPTPIEKPKTYTADPYREPLS